MTTMAYTQFTFTRTHSRLLFTLIWYYTIYYYILYTVLQRMRYIWSCVYILQIVYIPSYILIILYYIHTILGYINSTFTPRTFIFFFTKPRPVQRNFTKRFMCRNFRYIQVHIMRCSEVKTNFARVTPCASYNVQVGILYYKCVYYYYTNDPQKGYKKKNYQYNNCSTRCNQTIRHIIRKNNNIHYYITR